MEVGNVRFGSKADIPQRNRHVCFTPKSGHQAFMSTRARFERSRSGSLAIFAAIRRASSLVSNLAADRRPRLILKIDVAELLAGAVMAQDRSVENPTSSVKLA